MLFLAATAAPASATLTIHVISPQSGISSGSPIFFEAEGQSDCKAGVSALRIYSAPGVAAYTTASPHLETFVELSPGTYNTVVQAWDNCGAVAKVPVTITVTSESKVTVFLPSGSSEPGPVHFAASAQSPGCTSGIAAMRIYTSWGFPRYSVTGNELNAYVQLSPEAVYNATLQAWDNCGNVLKTNFQITASGGRDAYAYVADEKGIGKFNILGNGQLATDNPPYAVAINTGAQTLVKHPGGWFIYTCSGPAIYGYAVNPQTGSLTPVPGSPSYFKSPVSYLFMDPAGDFLYATQPQPLVTGGPPPTTILSSFEIDHSSGAIKLSSTKTVPETVLAITTDPYGRFLYASGALQGNQPAPIYAYKVRPNSGALTAAYGSPFGFPGGGAYVYALSSAYQYLYAANLGSTGDGDLASYQINYNSGSLYGPLGPYDAPQISPLTQSMLADWLDRYIWVANTTDNGNSYLLYNLDGYTGAMSGPHQVSTGAVPIVSLAESDSAHQVYVVGGNCSPVTCVPGVVSAWAINGDAGGVLKLLNSLKTQGNNPSSVVAVRANPE